MPDCSCIKGDYNFVFEALDCKTYIYRDMSMWMNEEYYTLPDTYEVGIQIPGCKETVSLDLKISDINKITSKDLGFNRSEDKLYLPDGIYCFKVTNCGVVYQRTKAITCTLDCKIQFLASNAETDKDYEFIERSKSLINSVHAKAELGKLNQAQALYRMAVKQLDCVDCKC